ncbi:hypothetical protein [Aliiglaciecola sp. M165]|uniref:hypothetical protein n=1 Tax=Aliiglaciecola sp. M165 TaxID=2593649 RepID=UPI00117FA32D|nr:hypothetical protein [Aliiglaciecola sp. M165]TRY31448.1 hypothetical protein FM019_11285 [Aliiglaciecola sp. M165]
MVKYLCLLMTLVGTTCQAQDNFVSQSVNWLKSSLPDTVNVEFNKSRIKFNGCKHREYELKLTQPFTENFSFEGGLTYAKGQLSWGINNQKISLKRYSVMPRYEVNHYVSVSAGMVLQSAPEFKSSQGVQFELPESRIYMITSRFKGVREDHHVDLEFSSHRWESTGELGSLFDNGFIDNKVNVSYSAYF